MSNNQIQNESHDWLADAAESLVRYYFAKRGFYAYGAGKWGVDCVLQNKESGKILTVEVKSTDTDKKSALLVKDLRKQLKKISSKVRPDKYAEVRLKEFSSANKTGRHVNMAFEISIHDIDKKRGGLK